uniref:Uncharacterized protein n=1 Tax=Kalanchoe fedtschenkoi TaxID=63787 RepID=A0A7N0VAY6_KALFE
MQPPNIIRDGEDGEIRKRELQDKYSFSSRSLCDGEEDGFSGGIGGGELNIDGRRRPFSVGEDDRAEVTMKESGTMRSAGTGAEPS